MYRLIVQQKSLGITANDPKIVRLIDQVVAIVLFLLLPVTACFLIFQYEVVSGMLETQIKQELSGNELYATQAFSAPLIFIFYAGYSGARTRNKDRMGFFVAGAFITGVYFIPQTAVFYGLFYKGLCGLYKDAEAMGPDAVQAALKEGVPDKCTAVYGVLLSMAFSAIFCFVAAYKGYELYESKHFDPNIQDDMMMMDLAPKTTGYTVGQPVQAAVAAAPAMSNQQPMYHSYEPPQEPVAPLPYHPPSASAAARADSKERARLSLRGSLNLRPAR